MSDVKTTGWVGWGWFAGAMLLTAGIIDLIYGFVAISGPDSAYFVGDDAVVLLDIAGWGWWHVISGAALILVALALFGGAAWARVVAIILAILNAVGQMFLITEQPWLSLALIALDILVIYALTVHGRELTAAAQR
ncbi:hypothetical protein [Agromyces sp. NPDC058110]|uniref:DUF7144 family membrane protein n=1 Tax=Agromyces sp. NPDC058110 TaxID=3346345 RepID=UPI0036DDEA03